MQRNIWYRIKEEKQMRMNSKTQKTIAAVIVIVLVVAMAVIPILGYLVR